MAGWGTFSILPTLTCRLVNFCLSHRSVQHTPRLLRTLKTHCPPFSTVTDTMQQNNQNDNCAYCRWKMKKHTHTHTYTRTHTHTHILSRLLQWMKSKPDSKNIMYIYWIIHGKKYVTQPRRQKYWHGQQVITQETKQNATWIDIIMLEKCDDLYLIEVSSINANVNSSEYTKSALYSPGPRVTVQNDTESPSQYREMFPVILSSLWLLKQWYQ